MKFKQSFITAALTLAVSSQAHSAAFQLAENSASGLGRAYAGDAVIADNAAVLSRNPASMALFKEKSLSIVTTFVDPNVKLTGVAAPEGADPTELDESSIVPIAFIPAVAFVNPVNDKFAWGIGMHTDYGLKSEFPEDYAAGSLAGSTEILTFNLNGSLSYRINEYLSIGAGLNVIYADGELIRNVGHSPLNGYGIPREAEAVNLEGDDLAYGWNAGLIYELNKDHRFGLSYRTSTDITLEGSYSNQLPAMIGGLEGKSVPGSLAIELPDVAEFSGFHKLTNEYAVHYSAMWTGWSSFDQLKATGENGETLFYKEEHFTNSWRYAIGMTYNYADDIVLRTGIAYDDSPAPTEHRSISIPDNNRVWYSAGATFIVSDKESIDFGATLVDVKKGHVTETDAFGQTWEFVTQADVYILSLQYNHTF